MMIIGSDYHPGFQQIAFVDTESGELQERRLQHREEAEKFYRDLAAQAVRVRVVAATMRRTMRARPGSAYWPSSPASCGPLQSQPYQRLRESPAYQCGIAALTCRCQGTQRQQ